jgi:hypothetical protein
MVDHTNHDPTSGVSLDGEAASMATNRNTTNPERDNPPWLGFARFLLIMIFTAMLFLLVKSMVNHHFFDGGQLNLPHTDGP